jgi:hypothetical protein
MRRLISFLVPFVAALMVTPLAFAAWVSTGAGSGTATATSVKAGNSPEASRYNGTVPLTWGASTLASGDPVGYYDVIRTSGDDALPVCEGVHGTSCTDTDPLPGQVSYAVIPRIGAHWTGAQSVATTFQYDEFAPTTTATLSPSSNNSGWNNAAVDVTLTAIDPSPVSSGVSSIFYAVNGGAPTEAVGASVTFRVSEEQQYAIEYWAVDNLGNTESPKGTQNVKIDATAPVSSSSLTGDQLTLSATDAGGSTVSSIQYRFGTSGPYTLYTVPLTLTSGQTVYFHAVDVAGNVESPDHSVTYTATPTDTQKPVTSVGSSPVPNAAGWTTANTTLTLSSTDNMAVAKLEYRNGSGAFVTITGPGPYTLPVYTTEGTTTLEYRATDTNGNVEDLKTYAVKIDKTVPAAPASKPANGASFTNNNSGISSWEKACDGAPRVCATPAADTSGTGGVTFTLAATSGANTGKCWTGTVFQTATTCTALPMTRNQTTGQYESPTIAQALMLDGSYRLVLIVTDGAGLTTSTTINIAIT